MADTSQTRLRLVRWAAQGQRQASRRILASLDQRVPRGTGPRGGRTPLAASRKVTDTAAQSYTRTTVEYPTKVANFLEDGTRPHVIRARRGKALRFVWTGVARNPASRPASGRVPQSTGTATYFFRSVHHPGSTKQRGWWSGIVNQRRWERQLRDELSRVRF